MKSKLKTLIIIKLLIISISSYCQDFNLLTKTEFQNYIQKQDLYFDSIVTIKGTESGIEGYKEYKRWKEKYQEMVYNDNGLQNVLEAQHYFNRNYQSIISNQATYNACWEEMGPFDVPATYNGNYIKASGTGRIFSIVFDPDNSNRLFAGSPTGGLFVSHDYGENWTPAGTDLLPTPGISHFVLMPETANNTETWFVLTGDGDNKWTFSYGIFRSQNQGKTWEDVSGGIYFPNLDNWNQSVGRKMLHNPANPNQMLVIYNYGLYKTNNVLASNPANVKWTEKIDGHFTDICAKPNTNNQVINATSRDVIYMSNDYGENWSPMPNLQQVNFMDNSADRRVTLRTTADNPNVLYAVIISQKDSAHSQIYKYNSATQNWIPKGVLMTGDTAVGWGRYQSFEVSPNDENHLYQARVSNIRKSTDGGISWTNKTAAKHDDTHWIAFDPNNYNKIWVGTDGGVSYSPNDCDTMYYKTKGLSVGNINRISTAETLSDFIIYGGFDIGSALNENDNHNLRQLLGGDAYGSVIDDTDPENPIYYVTSNSSSPSKSIDNGVSFSSIPLPETIRVSGWNHCIIKDFDTQTTLFYAGLKRIGRTINGGASWEPISPIAGDSVVPIGNGQTDTVNYIYWEVFNSKNNPNYLYTYRSTGIGDWDDYEANRVYKSTNANATDPTIVSWTDISPVINNQLIDHYWWADIAVNNTNPDEIWLCRSGYGNSDPKILHYENNIWSDITQDVNNTLDNLSIFSIKHVSEVDDLLIIGTNAGVYFRSNSNPVWTKMLGLPNIIVKEIIIQEKEKKILIATYGRGVWKGDIPCILPGNDYNITTNTTWNRDTLFSGNVYVKQGSRLTINPCEIQFAPGKKLIVEQGAELFIYGATLDSRCNEVWGGIEVWGNRNLSQSPSSNQGAVRTYPGTVIKNADCGIRAIKYTDEPVMNTAGGIVLAIGTQFINNAVGVTIPYYSAFSNTSLINNCVFKITDNISSDVGMPIGVNLVAGTNVAITDNQFLFENSNEELRLRSIGIKNFGASATINKRQSGNYFNGWNYGIYSSGIYGADHVMIRENNFEECITGIYMSGNANCEIILNEFNIPGNETGPHFAGLYLDNCNSFTVEENSFQAYYNPVYGANSIGLVINNSGPYINEVYKNNFYRVKFAVLAQGQNRATNGNGLSFKCNTFTNNGFDIVVTATNGIANPGIASIQGSSSTLPDGPAGNIFSRTGPPGTPTDLNNEESFFYYFYHNNQQDKLEPLYFTENTINKVPVNAPWNENSCPSNYNGGGSGGIEEIRGLMSGSGQAADSILNIITALQDGGDTDELSANVYTSTPPETMEVYNELMSTSPYLSDSVVETAIIKEEVLPNAMIRDVMVANPQSAKNNELMEAVDDRSNPMPDYMKAQILQGKSIISAFEQLKSNYAYNKNLSNKAYQQAKNWYLSDTLNPEQSYDSLLSLLGQRQAVNAKYQLVSYYLQKNDIVEATNQLNEIPNQLELSSYELAEYNDMQNFYGLLFNVQQNNLIFTELNNEQLSLLEDLELEGNGRVQQYARNIRLNLGLSDYVEPYIIPDINKSTEMFNFETELLKSIDEVKYLEVFPNPAKDYVILKYLIESNLASPYLQITNASGKVLETIDVLSSEDQIVIDTKNYKSGVYIATLIINSEVAESVKFNVIN